MLFKKYGPVRVNALTRGRGRPPGPAKWDRKRLARFLVLYADGYMRHGLGHRETLRIVSLIENINHKGAEKRLAEARIDVPPRVLPSWARPILKRGRRRSKPQVAQRPALSLVWRRK